MMYQIIIYLVIIAAILLFYVSGKIYSNRIRSHINKRAADNDQELCEEDLKLYKEKKKKEILKRQLLSQSYSSDKSVIDDTRVVSVIEPIGKWTRLVMNEHFMKLMNIRNIEGKNGFWQIFVSMQGMMQGKSRYKGR